MKENVDALIVVSNNKLYDIYPDLDIDEAFSKADDILTVAARGITEIITKPGKINVDFNDVKRVMSNSGVAIIGIGRGTGENRASLAIDEAMNSPLLEDADIYGAKGVVLYITYGNGVKMRELDLITESIQKQTQTDCEIIWGVCKDESLDDDIAITLVATGFQTGELQKGRRQEQRDKQEKVVYTLHANTSNTSQPENKKETPKFITEEQKEIKSEEIGIIGEKPTIQPTPDTNQTTNLNTVVIPTPPTTSNNNNEFEFEINLTTKNSDIKIVDQSRFNYSEETDKDERKTTLINETQFTLFETPDNKNLDGIDHQDLERDLIKKRITLDMQKHHISLYELEKEPAYKRFGMELDDSIPSDESNFSNYMIFNNSEDPSKIEIRPNAMKNITLD